MEVHEKKKEDIVLCSRPPQNVKLGSCAVTAKNRPFYRYGGHIELIRFKEYYRMPRWRDHINFVCIFERFSGLKLNEMWSCPLGIL